jgi:hypothetical protein
MTFPLVYDCELILGHLPGRPRGRAAQIDLPQCQINCYRDVSAIAIRENPPNMPPRRPPKADPQRRSRRLSLGEACRENGLDALGQRCPACPLKALCVSETRWRVRRPPRPRYLI